MFSGEYDVIVNCLGLECRSLLNDKDVYPARGHLVRVKAPWIKECFVVNGAETCIYVGQDNVVLGGTRDQGQYALDYNSQHFQKIIDKCSKIYPSLKNAEVENVWVGLRPYRTTVRVEKEFILVGDDRICKVVHNYGHGAHGVGLSWGTAEYATKLVMDILNRSESEEDQLKSKL